MRPLALFVLFLVSVALEATTVRLATWNVRNYTITDRLTENGWRPNFPKPENEKRVLRRILTTVRPDVLAIQEIGGEEFLRELQRDLEREGLDYPYATVLEGPDEQRALAFLSKLPFDEVWMHDDLTVRVNRDRLPHSRGVLGVTFVTEGQRWSVVNLHLKSRRTTRQDDPGGEIKRTAEAQVARDLLRRRFPPGEGDWYVVAGDLNDYPRSSAVRRLLQVSDTTLTIAMEAADSRGETWTHLFRGEDLYSRVDYLLASPAMYEAFREPTGVLHDPPDYFTASDHRLVYIDLDFAEVRKP